jgi:mono/diheme cytochrome c family protein
MPDTRPSLRGALWRAAGIATLFSWVVWPLGADRPRPPLPAEAAAAAESFTVHDSPARQAEREAALQATALPQPVPPALLTRGRQRYLAACAGCHARGADAPPLRPAQLARSDDAHLYDVITHGWGAMYSLAARIPPEDRWAIVAYLRQVQGAGGR